MKKSKSKSKQLEREETLIGSKASKRRVTIVTPGPRVPTPAPASLDDLIESMVGAGPNQLENIVDRLREAIFMNIRLIDDWIYLVDTCMNCDVTATIMLAVDVLRYDELKMENNMKSQYLRSKWEEFVNRPIRWDLEQPDHLPLLYKRLFCTVAGIASRSDVDLHYFWIRFFKDPTLYHVTFLFLPKELEALGPWPKNSELEWFDRFLLFLRTVKCSMESKYHSDWMKRCVRSGLMAALESHLTKCTLDASQFADACADKVDILLNYLITNISDDFEQTDFDNLNIEMISFIVVLGALQNYASFEFARTCFRGRLTQLSSPDLWSTDCAYRNTMTACAGCNRTKNQITAGLKKFLFEFAFQLDPSLVLLCQTNLALIYQRHPLDCIVKCTFALFPQNVDFIELHFPLFYSQMLDNFNEFNDHLIRLSEHAPKVYTKSNIDDLENRMQIWPLDFLPCSLLILQKLAEVQSSLMSGRGVAYFNIMHKPENRVLQEDICELLCTIAKLSKSESERVTKLMLDEVECQNSSKFTNCVLKNFQKYILQGGNPKALRRRIHRFDGMRANPDLEENSKILVELLRCRSSMCVLI